MSLRGFWNKASARNKKDKNELRGPPKHTCPLEGDWRDHPDRAAVARAEVALCTLPKVS